MAEALLEVAVHHARDVPGCTDGGADRLALQVADDTVGRSPDLAAAAAVIRSTELPVRVLLRLNDSFTTSGGEMVRLVGLAEEYLALGAEGVGFGFLDADLEVDEETCAALAEKLPGVPWTFHRGFDAALDAGRSWRRVRRLPHLTAVCSGGSMSGLERGYDELLARAESDPEIARLLMPGSGLQPEQVPWFARAGVTQFHVAEQVRPGGTSKAYVDADYVRSWRRMIDASVARGAASA
ncbi:MAG TPA: copper homeostasis protein CutC [Nocardioides sp.]|nr:copper homeostasis protein CutC [Nocardioides sp.]